jgi:hypothetical protein
MAVKIGKFQGGYMEFKSFPRIHDEKGKPE